MLRNGLQSLLHHQLDVLGDGGGDRVQPSSTITSFHASLDPKLSNSSSCDDEAIVVHGLYWRGSILWHLDV
jgi:hypothetical protein